MRLFNFFKKSDTSLVRGVGPTLSAEEMAYRTWLASGGSDAESDSGMSVNIKTASAVSAVLACCTLIANGLSQIPFRLYRRRGRYNDLVTDHPLYELFEWGPNPYVSGYEFRNTMGLHLALCGNAYVWLNRVGGKIVEMFNIEPQNVCLNQVVGGDGWEVVYQVSFPSGRSIEVPAADMWHLKWRAYDSIRGLRPVQLAQSTIGLALASEKHVANVMRTGAHPSGILKFTGVMTDEQKKELRKEWTDKYVGARNAGKTVLLPASVDYQPIPGVSNNDTQFVENREFQVTELCRYWGVVPMMIGQYQNSSTYASTEQLSIQHVIHTMGPWYANVESSAGKFLFNPKEKTAGYYWAYDDDGLLRGDSKSRADWYQKMASIGAFSVNDIRAKENLPPVDGGDVNVTQGANIPLTMLGINYGVTPEGEPLNLPKQDEDGNDGAKKKRPKDDPEKDGGDEDGNEEDK